MNQPIVSGCPWYLVVISRWVNQANKMSKLESKICTIILPFFVIYLASCVYGAPKIVAPYPNNVYAIEDTRTKVTCVVEDADSNPDEIIFVRKSRFGDIIPISDEGTKGRRYYQNETLENGKKLRVTLHFNKVVLNDDSRYGGYECQGHTGGSQHEYGFTVTVIEQNELPGIDVSKNVSAKFGDKIVLNCNLTISKAASADQTKLTKLMWAKDGRLIEEVLYPREQSLKSLEIDVDSPDVGGIYTCHLTSKLRNVKEYNVTGNIYVSVKPKFFIADLGDNKIIVMRGESVQFICSAQGNPLKTEWKRKPKYELKAKLIEAGSNTSDFQLSNMDKLKDHSLSIEKVDYNHRGKYYCCIKDNDTRAEHDTDNCHTFTLRVKDPLGPLWPVIGIIIEVILLFIIIYVSEKIKNKKNKSTKADDRVDFSYSSTDDNGDKGHVRLRQTAGAAPTDAEKA